MNFPKYVIKEFGDGTDHVHLLPITMGHSDVFSPEDKIVSAGFFQLYVKDGKVDVNCFGKSHSLNGVESRPEEDRYLLRRFLMLED